jgi:hypothetical protein
MPTRVAADEGLVTSHRTSGAPHGRGRALTALLGALTAALLLAPGASAEVIKVETPAGPTTVGVQPTSISAPLDGDGKGGGGAPDAKDFNNPEGDPVVEGNPTTHAIDTYLIYWDPSDLYHGEWQGLVDRYMSELSGGSEKGSNDVFTVDTQYTDLANTGMTGRVSDVTRFLGAYTDTNAYPQPGGCTDPLVGMPLELTCLSDAQIREQLHTFIGEHGLKAGMETIFFVLTPPAVGVCVAEGPSDCSQNNEEVTAGGLCSYHSYYTDPQYGTVLYAAIPWTYGDLGGIYGGDAGVACQDGGWNVNAEKGGPLEQPSKGPLVPQEPNQLTTVGGDGTWDEGLADITINQVAAEQQNTITDPLLNAWQDREKVGGEEVGYEDTDECRNFFLAISEGSASKKEHTEAGDLSNQKILGGAYYLNDAFNLAALKLSYPGVPCLPGITITPVFTEPPTVNTGEIVGFNGMESDVSLNAGEKFSAKGEEPSYPTYTWNFGDGSPEVTGYAPGAPQVNSPASSPCPNTWESPCAASAFHAYQYSGVYQVTLTVKDVAGNTGAVAHTITVEGTPPPATSPTTSPGAGPGGSGSGSAGGSSSTSPLPPPVASAAAVSSSLKQVARSGLLVRYAVNEQVTGRFEVLLEAAAAHRMRISGPLATNLPAGFPKSVVIGHALLVTLKGGHSTVRIKFPKSTAKRLRHAHKVTLTLRLIVRNASPQGPLFTTVMSSSVLH